jgi:hypothetical protein
MRAKHMPGGRVLRWQLVGHQTFCMVIACLMLSLFVSSKVLAGILVNSKNLVTINYIGSTTDLGGSLNPDRANLVIVPQLIPHATPGSAAVAWTTGRILTEVGKQAFDQPGHFLIGAAPIWASRCLVGVPWFGWVGAPILAYREWLQWPSRRWWDPPLDWAFLTLGAVMATWSRRRGHGLADGLATFGRTTAAGLGVRGRMPRRV